MSDGIDLKQLVRSRNLGIAIVEPETWSIVFENAKFFRWFPPTGDSETPLTERLPLNIMPKPVYEELKDFAAKTLYFLESERR